MLLRLSDFLRRWLGWRVALPAPDTAVRRTPRSHVIIIDGTMSSLTPGFETNAGLSYNLISETGAAWVHYEAGLQWHDWASTLDVLLGRGINDQIRRAYGVLASRYKPGDRIYLMGYSRGAYAVRSLAGVIEKIGLLQANHTTVRNIRQVYRHYQSGADGLFADRFRALYCHDKVQIEVIAVWDTVRALGANLPLFAAGPPPHSCFMITDWVTALNVDIRLWLWMKIGRYSRRFYGIVPTIGVAICNRCGFLVVTRILAVRLATHRPAGRCLILRWSGF